MKNYNIKDLKLMNMARENGGFACESGMSNEDKIVFVDSFQDGALSYFIAIVEKFLAECDNLKKDAYGNIRTVSKQAWLRKNDTRGLISRDVGTWWNNCGAFQLLGVRANVFYPRHNFVDECFHAQLEQLLLEEQRYYNEHNDEQKVIKNVCHTLSRYGYPDNRCFSIGGDDFISTDFSFQTDEYAVNVCLPNADRRLTIEEVKVLEVALAPVEEKHQQLLKAQEEMENALRKAGFDFSAYLSTKGEST